MNQLTGAVIGAAIEVHRVLGAGFLELVYEEALAAELELRGICFSRQKVVAVNYSKRQTAQGFYAEGKSLTGLGFSI
jgi:GxxExxY protein